MGTTNTVFFWIIPALLVLFVLLYPGLSRIVAYFKRMRKSEDERRQAEIQRQMVADQQVEALRGRRFVVFIREKDERKSSFESVLIRCLLERGVVVLPMTEGVGKNLVRGFDCPFEDDRIALVGTAWYRKEEGETCCDYRILCNAEIASESTGQPAKISIVGAGMEKSRFNLEDILASSIIQDIAAQLWRRKVSE